MLLLAKRADGLTNTNLVERPTILNSEGPGTPVVAADSAILEVPDPELPPWEANAAQPENIAPANSTSTIVILRILRFPAGFAVQYRKSRTDNPGLTQDMYRYYGLWRIGSSASLVMPTKLPRVGVGPRNLADRLAVRRAIT